MATKSYPMSAADVRAIVAQLSAEQVRLVAYDGAALIFDESLTEVIDALSVEQGHALLAEQEPARRSFPMPQDDYVAIVAQLPDEVRAVPGTVSYDAGALVIDEAHAGLIEGLTVAAGAAIILARTKTALKALVDAAAERERLKYITGGAGQAMTYQAKSAEALRLDALPAEAEPDPADYPLLAAEIGITAPTLREVGAIVLAAYRQWLAIGAAIEAARLSAKQAIDAAADAAAAEAVTAVWPEPA